MKHRLIVELRIQAKKTEQGDESQTNLTPGLKAKIAKVAAKLKCSEGEATAKILSDGVGKYLPKSLLGGESDESDALDI